jgi:hypothetical protein
MVENGGRVDGGIGGGIWWRDLVEVFGGRFCWREVTESCNDQCVLELSE